MELSRRLQAVADLVSEGMRVADVGTDHGYISIYLAQSKKSPSVIAMDINAGPLSRAQLHIEAYGLKEKITTRQSDGVKALQEGECDCVIVAGMGGALAVKIVEEGKAIFDTLKEFILQPQSELEKVRACLWQSGFRVIAEDMVLEDGKFYPMMKVVVGESEDYTLPELRYGKELLRQKHPVLKQFLEKEIQNKEQILGHLQQEQGSHIEARRNELQAELEVAKETLAYF